MIYCQKCLKKKQRINELEDEVTSLKAKLRYQERTAEEGFFGSSTPSSKVPVKPNSKKDIHAIAAVVNRVIRGMGGQVFANKMQTE